VSDDQQTADVHSRIDRIEVTLTHVTDAIEKMAAVVNPMEREAHVLRQKIQNLEARELDDARSLGRIEGTLGIKVDDE
jgi:chemotaxis regulatin CheY-phosphate phosphatase CheZ